MNTFAHVNKDGVVVNIVIGNAAVPDDCVEVEYWADGSQRKNTASIGGTYDPARDAFIDVKPYASWVLNEETCRWQAPVPMPDDGKAHDWNEQTLNWT